MFAYFSVDFFCSLNRRKDEANIARDADDRQLSGHRVEMDSEHDSHSGKESVVRGKSFPK